MNYFKTLAIYFLKLYSGTLALLLGGQCRFEPSCSRYAREAFLLCPPGRAFLKVLKRVLSCHPFHPGGWDPVENEP